MKTGRVAMTRIASIDRTTKETAIKIRLVLDGTGEHQIAAGVPLAVDEPADFRSFRIGLFGLDKLMHVDRTVENLDHALSALL